MAISVCSPAIHRGASSIYLVLSPHGSGLLAWNEIGPLVSPCTPHTHARAAWISAVGVMKNSWEVLGIGVKTIVKWLRPKDVRNKDIEKNAGDQGHSEYRMHREGERRKRSVGGMLTTYRMQEEWRRREKDRGISLKSKIGRIQVREGERKCEKLQEDWRKQMETGIKQNVEDKKNAGWIGKQRERREELV